MHKHRCCFMFQASAELKTTLHLIPNCPKLPQTAPAWTPVNVRRLLKHPRAFYGVKIIKVYPTQQSLWEAPKHPIFFSSPAFIAFCPFVGRDSVEKKKKRKGKKAGASPSENVIFQISFKTLWLGFKPLLSDTNASVSSRAQIPSFIFHSSLNLGAQPFQEPNNGINKINKSLTCPFVYIEFS